MSYQPPQRPARVIRAGNIRIPIWVREIEKDGRTFPVHSSQIQNQYFDEDVKQWQDSKTYTAKDLADLELAVRQAREFMRLKIEEPVSADQVAAEPV